MRRKTKKTVLGKTRKSKKNVSGHRRVLCGSVGSQKGGQDMAKKRANGEGNIRKRKDGRWEGRYTAGYDPATRQKQEQAAEKMGSFMQQVR